MRLVDADALNLSMMQIAPGETKKYCYPCREILKEIDDAPTIDPVRKGRKINQHSYPAKWLCSECGAKHFDFGDKFCSKCGANVERR